MSKTSTQTMNERVLPKLFQKNQAFLKTGSKRLTESVLSVNMSSMKERTTEDQKRELKTEGFLHWTLGLRFRLWICKFFCF